MKKAEEHLQKSDPILAGVIGKVKLHPRKKATDHFRSLCESILSQQISTAAADTITARFQAIFRGTDFPNPSQVLKASEVRLREAGISRQKINYLKDLAASVKNGSLSFQNFNQLSDEEIIADLIRIKGIGRWTAEMFLMFSMNRPDVFSAGDLGLQNAIKKLYRLKKHPSPGKIERISRAWKPYRTLAARYLWASML